VFTLYKKDANRIHIKVWLSNREQLEEKCLQQADNLSNLPFAHHHIALMPDTHSGYGMPIGGVLATEGVIIPNAVGVDIGCGMAFLQTNIPVELLKTDTGQGKLIQVVIGDVMRSIPVGFSHHKKPQESKVLDYACSRGTPYTEEELVPEIEAGYYQLGTLGGGNHFIEIQEDEEGKVGIMLHSGSRNFGYKVCKYFNKLAKKLNKLWYSSVPKEYDMAFFPWESEEGLQYVHWMNLALEFARENRSQMMIKTKYTLLDLVQKYTGFSGYQVGETIDCHHNYATIEHHFDKNVWVHRKGAIRARKGDIGIIPGAMGSYSYIVEGLGNPESFHSCSHGAGRNFSRKKAKEKYSIQDVLEDLKTKGVILGKYKKDDVAEECRMAYKDIDFVIGQELDLITPIKKLQTIGVVKG